MLAQYLGSFTATAIIYGLYHESLEGFDRQHFNGESLDIVMNTVNNTMLPSNNSSTDMLHSVTTAGIFITLPSPFISLAPAIGDQVFSTGLLVFTLLFIADETFFPTPIAIQTLTTCFALLAFIVGFNFNCNAILNPGKKLKLTLNEKILSLTFHFF